MLKNNKQRGTGLRLVPTGGALSACFETTTRPGMEGVPLYRWYLAQQYVNAPLLINGRKFGLRLWVLVPGAEPLRVYLHANGLALFSAARYEPAGLCSSRVCCWGGQLHGLAWLGLAWLACWAGSLQVSTPTPAATTAAAPAGSSAQSAGAGHITNFAQNEAGDVWSLHQVARHMGTSAWQVGLAGWWGCKKQVAGRQQTLTAVMPGCMHV
jgi:hypothetical protein